MISENRVKIIKFLLILFHIIISHVYPTYTFLLSGVLLVCAHSLNLTKIKNYFTIFLFILWPLLFYTYLHYFVEAIVDAGLVQPICASPYYIKLNGDSLIFLMARVHMILTVPFPLLGFGVKTVFFRHFLMETFFWLVAGCNYIGLEPSIRVL